MKILAGAHSRDEGEIVVDGELVGRPTRTR